MADLLPSTPDVSAAEEADPRVVGVDSDDADELLSALSSDTARALLAALHDDPANPAALADRVGTSLQNAQYHLSNLQDAGLIEVVDTAYSEKGREMNVYAPSDRPLVVYAGKEEETGGLRAALSRLLGAVAALGVGSVVVQALFEGPFGSWFGAAPGTGGTGGGGTATSTSTGEPGGGLNLTRDATATPSPEGTATATAAPTNTPGTMGRTPTPTDTPAPTGTPTPAATSTPGPTPTETATRTATEAATATPASEPVTAAVEPGLLFFAGGLLVLALAVVWFRRAG